MIVDDRKQAPPVITRHAPLNSIKGTLDVKPIKTTTRSSAPGRTRLQPSEDLPSSSSSSTYYLNIPNRMYDLYDFSSKTFWRNQLDSINEDNKLHDKDIDVSTMNGDVDGSDIERGLVKISYGHNLGEFFDESIEKLKFIDNVQMETDENSYYSENKDHRSKGSSMFQISNTTYSDTYTLTQLFLLMVRVISGGVDAASLYLHRLIALTIEPFQDVSGVASIGPHIFVSLLILIAVVLFNSGDEDHFVHDNPHAPVGDEIKVEIISGSEITWMGIKHKSENVERRLEAPYDPSLLLTNNGQQKLDNDHVHTKDETKETPKQTIESLADENSYAHNNLSKTSLRVGVNKIWNRFWVPVFTATFIWLYLTSIENIQRNRIVYKIESNTFKSLFEAKNSVVNKICVSYAKHGKKAVDAYVDISMLDLLCSAHETVIGPSKNVARGNSTSSYSDTTVKSLFWLNKLLVSFWSVESTGGLGPYFSQTIEDVLTEQLAMVPPSIAQLNVKRFSVGSIPPIIRGVQVKSYFGQGACQSNAHVTSDLTSHSEQVREGASENPNKINSASNINAGNKNKENQNGHKGPDKSSIFSIKEEIQRQMKYTRQYLKMHAGGTVHSDDIKGECEHVIIDADFSFSSEDMDIEFQLRSSTDGAVAIPDATVSVSHVVLRGKLRMDMESLPNFPFIGNTSIAFHQVPELDMAISSFGGVDLSILPGMHSWINVTLSWVLMQLAHPNYITVDMLPLICPDCVNTKVL